MLAGLLLEIILAIFAWNMMMGSLDAVVTKQTFAEEENALSVVHNFLYSWYEDKDLCVPANTKTDYSKPIDGSYFKQKAGEKYVLQSTAKSFDRCDIMYDSDSRTLYVRIGAKTFRKTQLPAK